MSEAMGQGPVDQIAPPVTPLAMAEHTTAQAEAALTPAQRLGLVDGAFFVNRHGVIETGWTVTGIGFVANNESGVREPAIRLNKPTVLEDGSAGYLDTAVMQKDLLALQPERFTKEDLRTDMEQLRVEMQAAHIGKSALGGDISLPAEAEQELARLHESNLNERQRVVFAPVESSQDTQSEDALDLKLDMLFDPSYDNSVNSVEDAAIRNTSMNTREITDEYEGVAEYVMNTPALDPQVKSIIAVHSPNTTTPRELVRAVQSDPSLRYALAEYLVAKIHSMSENMPARIRANSQKSPDHQGYRETMMTSQEYAALLAISMLDGSYKPDASSDDDDIRKDSQGNVTIGQHRYAAQAALYW